MPRREPAGRRSRPSRRPFRVPEALEAIWERRAREETDRDPEWEALMTSQVDLERLVNLEDHGVDLPGSDTIEHRPWESCLRESGWEFLDSSVRMVYHKLNTVLKIAVDVSGMVQNYMECLAYGDNVENLDGTGSSDGVSVLRVPRLLSRHDRYYWVVQQMTPEGIFPKKVPADLMSLLKEWRFEDLRTENFVLHAQPGREEYWFYDLGCYCYDPLERAGAILRG